MRTLLVVAAVVGASGCNQLFVEAHVSALCEHLPAQTFRLPANAVIATTASMEKTFSFDISVQVPPQLSSAELNVALSNVTLTAVGATTDFGFVHKAKVTLLPPPGSTLSAHPVVDFEKVGATPKALHFAGDDFDLAPYLTASVMSYSVEFEGRMPPGDVTADVDACAAVSMKYNYAQ